MVGVEVVDRPIDAAQEFLVLLGILLEVVGAGDDHVGDQARIVVGGDEDVGARLVAGLEGLRQRRLVGGDRRHARIGEDGDGVGRGDVLHLQVLQRQAVFLQLHLRQQAGRHVRLDGEDLALEIAGVLDRAVGNDAVAAERNIDRADDRALRLRRARAALMLADGAHVALDVAALERRQHVDAVVVERLVDGQPLLAEVAELIGQIHRCEPRPERIGAVDGIVGRRRMAPTKDRQSERCGKHQVRSKLHFPLPVVVLVPAEDPVISRFAPACGCPGGAAPPHRPTGT